MSLESLCVVTIVVIKGYGVQYRSASAPSVSLARELGLGRKESGNRLDNMR